MWAGLALAALAAAHDGDDHGAPAAPAAASADAGHVETWSSEFEVVLAPPALDEPSGHGSLWLADYRTSAPVDGAAVRLALHADRDETVDAVAGGSAGRYEWHLHPPLAAGPWGGSVTVLTEGRSDALGLPEFSLSTPIAAAGTGGPGWGGALFGSFCALSVGLFAGLLFGRRAVPAALAVGVAAAALTSLRPADAHDGDEDAVPPAGPGLRLPLDSQFLLEVRTDVARTDAFVEEVRAFGVAIGAPGGLAEVRAPVAGVLQGPPGAPIIPGQAVAAGQILAVLREPLGAVDRADLARLRAEAQLRLAEARRDDEVGARDLERSAELGEVLTERDRLLRARDVEVAREALRQAESELASLSGVGTHEVRAPIAGRLGAFGARPGATVDAGAVLARVHGSGGVWVDAHVPEALAGRLVAGSAALLVADARPDEPIAATLLDPGLEADPATGAVHVVLAPVASPDWLRPGMTVAVQLAAAAPRQAVVVPDAAIVDSAGETLVFVKTSPESFEPRPVRVGGRSGARREVVAGLDAGERVVVQGTWTLRSLAGR